MPMNVYTMESANLICGDVGEEPQPGLSTHLILDELKLPAMEENYVDHIAGFAPMCIEINTHFTRLECTFNLAGWQPDIMRLLGRSIRELQRFTAYGMIREQRRGFPLQAMALIWGRLGRVNPTAFRKGDKMQHEYSLRSITHYELYMQSNIESPMTGIYYWDFFENTLAVGNVDITNEENRILGTGLLTGRPVGGGVTVT